MGIETGPIAGTHPHPHHYHHPPHLHQCADNDNNNDIYGDSCERSIKLEVQNLHPFQFNHPGPFQHFHPHSNLNHHPHHGLYNDLGDRRGEEEGVVHDFSRKSGRFSGDDHTSNALNGYSYDDNFGPKPESDRPLPPVLGDGRRSPNLGPRGLPHPPLPHPPPPPGPQPHGYPLPHPHPMSPRGQQCERGVVDGQGLPPSSSPSSMDMKDEALRRGAPDSFDRQCVSQMRGPSMMGGGSDDTPPGVCAGCGRRILDRYYLQAVDKQWHVQCLTCSDCHFRLDSELTCFARDGQIYCKEDYYRRFASKRCSRCHLGISANELVMRARDQVFHLTCFSCTACNRTLTPGEEFGLRDNLVYCRTDYELIFQGDYIPSLSPGMVGGHGVQGHSPNPNGPVPFYNGVGAVQKGRPRKRKSPLPDGDGCNAMGLNGLEMSDRPGDVLEREGYGHTPPRQKRVRTSFKHHQLRTMKSYFALNHNPDAKDLKQLAQKTGLSKRVLQVWFQNARAKYRRNLLKQQQDSDKPGQGQTTSPSGGDNKEQQKDGSGSMTDLSNTRSPALSDISSTPSLSDLHSSGHVESGGEQGSSSITELFSSTIASIN